MALGVQGGVVASLAALAAYLLVTRHSQQAGEVTRRSQQTGEAPAAAQRDAAPSAPGPAVEHRLHPLFGSSALLHEGDVLSPHHAGALAHMKAEMEACRLQPPVAYSETANYTQCDGAVLWEWDGYWQYRSRTAYHAYGHPDIDALAARAKGIITRTLASPRSPVGHPAAPKCQLRLRDIRFFLNKKGALNMWHYHYNAKQYTKNASIIAVYYMQTPPNSQFCLAGDMEDCGVGCCGEDTLACGWEENYDIPGAVCTAVKAGQLLFHPMWLPHRVPPTHDPENLRVALAMDFEMDNADCIPPAGVEALGAHADASQLRHQYHVAERLDMGLLTASASFLFHTAVPRQCDAGCFSRTFGRLAEALERQFGRDVGVPGPRSTPASHLAAAARLISSGRVALGDAAKLTVGFLATGQHRTLPGQFAVLRASRGSAGCRLVFSDHRAKQAPGNGVRSLWAPIYGTGAEQFASWFGPEFMGQAETVSTVLHAGHAIIAPSSLFARLVDIVPQGAGGNPAAAVPCEVDIVTVRTADAGG